VPAMRRPLISSALICASLLLFAAATQGQHERSARLANLTADVAKRATQGRFADSDFVSVAKSRFALMSKLAETDPQAVLDNALNDDTLARVPTNARKYFESRETLSGELEVVAECEEHDGRIHRYLIKEGRKFELAPAGTVDEQLTSGREVELNGVLIGDRAVFEGGQLKTVGSEQTTSSLSNTTGEKRVLVVLVNFQDKATQPFTVDQARNVTFNTTSNYFYENSYGQTWLTGDVYGWYTIPVSSTVCDKNAIATYAKQAAANAGADIASYNNLVYAFPSNACTFTGSANVGGTQPQVWINEWYELGVLGHELGHNLGLYHSRSMDCGATPIGESCTTSEYGDSMDLMGAASSAHFNGFQKERLGWVGGNGSVQTIQTTGTYQLHPYQPSGSDPKVLKVLKSTDPTTGLRTWYYLEKRNAIGFDGYLGTNANVMGGVIVRTGSESSGQQSYLLDMTPATTSWYDPALTVGQTFTDPAAGVTITVLSADSSGASVRVEMNAQPCVRANPSLTMTPSTSSWTKPGTAFTYQVTVTNNNSGGCGNELFNISANLPAGFTAAFSSNAVNLPNGSNTTVFADVASPVGSANGSYGFSFSAANAFSPAHFVSAVGTHVVVSSLNVIANAGAAKYSRSQTATVTSTVTAAGSPVANADVTFVLAKPNGATMSQVVRTGSDGRAVFSYKFNRKADPTGTYTVNANAIIKTFTGSASTSFLVNK
jgi:hypothetical protein